MENNVDEDNINFMKIDHVQNQKASTFQLVTNGTKRQNYFSILHCKEISRFCQRQNSPKTNCGQMTHYFGKTNLSNDIYPSSLCILIMNISK